MEERGGVGATFDAWYWPPGTSPPQETQVLEGPRGLRLCAPVLATEALRALARTLRAARAEILLDRSVDEIVAAVSAAARCFLDSRDPVRARALDLTGRLTGYSAAMSELVLDGMARDWLEDPLRRLLTSEFDDPGVLDGFRPGPAGSRVRAFGPPLSLHIGAGNVPGVTLTSMLRALLVKSAVIVKPAAADVALPTLFARALAQHDEWLARCIAVIYWRGGLEDLERAAMEEADLTVIYGSEEAVTALRRLAPPGANILPYHHRISFGVIGRDSLQRDAAAETAMAAARAAVIFEQRGCVSPHLYYVERGGQQTPEAFAEQLADALRRLEHELPAASLDAQEAAAIQQLRGAGELRRAAGAGVTVYCGEHAGWTVLYDESPSFEPSCLNRVLRVKPVSDLADVVPLIRPYQRYLQTVGVAGAGGRLAGFAEELGRAGVTRVTSLARVAWPPPWWHQDGLGPLRAMVSWVDLEPGD